MVKVIVDIPSSDLKKAIIEEVENDPEFVNSKKDYWLNGKEAADYLRMSEPRFYKFRNKGVIPFTEIDGVKRYYTKSIDEAMLEHETYMR